MTLPENGSDNVTLEFGELEFTLGFMSSVNGGPASEDESERRPLKCTGHVCACVDFFTWISFFHLYHDRCESAVCGFPHPPAPGNPHVCWTPEYRLWPAPGEVNLAPPHWHLSATE